MNVVFVIDPPAMQMVLPVLERELGFRSWIKHGMAGMPYVYIRGIVSDNHAKDMLLSKQVDIKGVVRIYIEF